MAAAAAEVGHLTATAGESAHTAKAAKPGGLLRIVHRVAHFETGLDFHIGAVFQAGNHIHLASVFLQFLIVAGVYIGTVAGFVQRFNGNQYCIVHTLDLYADAGSHTGKHTLCLCQFHHCGITAGFGTGTVNLRKRSFKRIVTDRAHRNRYRLSQIQRKNICLVHADGYRHFFVLGQRCYRGCCFLGVIHAVNAAVCTCQHRAVALNGQKLQQCLFQFRPLPQQRIIICAVIRVLEREQLAAVGYLRFHRCFYLGNGSCEAGNTQRTVDIQIPCSQNCVFTAQYRNGVVVLRTVIRYQNGSLAANYLLYCASNFLLIGQYNRHLIPYRYRIRFDIHRHIAIQRNQRQGTVFVHNLSHICALFAENRLDAAGDAGIDLGAGSVILCGTDLGIQLFNLCLQVRHCADYRGHIYCSQNIALGDALVGFDQHVHNLHALRNSDGFQIHIRQAAAAGHHCADRTGGSSIRKYLTAAGRELFAHPFFQEADTCHGNDRKHQYDRCHRNDDFSSFFLFVLVQGLEQRIVLVLGFGDFFGLLTEHRPEFVL